MAKLEEITRITRQSDDTVRRRFHRFLASGCAGLGQAGGAGAGGRTDQAVWAGLEDSLCAELFTRVYANGDAME